MRKLRLRGSVSGHLPEQVARPRFSPISETWRWSPNQQETLPQHPAPGTPAGGGREDRGRRVRKQLSCTVYTHHHAPAALTPRRVMAPTLQMSKRRPRGPTSQPESQAPKSLC